MDAAVATPPVMPPGHCQASLPVALHDWLVTLSQPVAVFIAADETMLQTLVRVMPAFVPDRRVLALPAWDNLPYDRARPSRQATGTRVATLAWLAADRDRPALVLTTPEALLQRVPPPDRVQDRAIPLRVGQALDPAWLRDTLLAFGYRFDDQVDEPGEAALHGATIDIHPAGTDAPLRLELADGRIAALRWFDPLTQRSAAETDRVRLLPTSEAFTVPGEALPDPAAPERLLPEGDLATLFDHVPDAAWGMVETADSRCASWLEVVHDAWAVAHIAPGPPPAPPAALYLTAEAVEAALTARAPTRFAEPDTIGDPPLPPTALGAAVERQRAAGLAVVLCGAAPLPALRSALARRLRLPADRLHPLETWRDALAVPPRDIGVMHLPLEAGFALPDRAVLAVRTVAADRPDNDDDALNRLATTLHLGDLVVDPDRGLARLTGLAMEDQAGTPMECLRLAFLAGEAVLRPATDADRIWRYGASSSVRPDRLDAANWQVRRTAVEQEIAEMATGLVRRMRERARRTAPAIQPSPAYRRFAARRPYALTRDQSRAIRTVQQDLASGTPMLRLVCGDVGFGKTEVALHAAALVATAGQQVAIIAPTTLLAQQHLDVFRRQLSGLGLRIEPLIRSSRSAQSRSVLRDIESGAVQIVVGTHAVAAGRFRDLGLVVIDEEQRFGEAQKRQLRTLQDSAHALTMTGTPLPRSLQAALAGLLDVSVLGTPPAGRQGGRTLVAQFDPVVIRTALLREVRRGGQAFVVCPRIEDIAPLETTLIGLVPELRLAVAHGRMRGEALDQVMLSFAAGDADVLLATSIIEAGLDLPNANTMLITGADRFGLAQLHQLRGRVGRGRVRASTWLLTDPTRPLSAAARKRLDAIAALDHLGAGFAVSLSDLDQRGAGDLLGDRQAGHVRLLGTELYRSVLQAALVRARGEPAPDDWIPVLTLDLPAFVPAEFVPEPDNRLAIYRQVARIRDAQALEDTADDLIDRFGDLPPPLLALLDLARLRLACRTRGIQAVTAGPAAIALTPRPGVTLRGPGEQREGRLVLAIAEASPERRLHRLLDWLGEG
jgi:transcription-repair coupling factor (superfamily II helicase)